MPAPQIYRKPSKTARWLVDHSNGLIQTERQADRILLVVSVVFIAIAVFLFYQLVMGNRPDISLEEADRLLLETLK